MMRLALLYDAAFRGDGSGLWTERAYGSYVDSLAPHFSRLLVIAPLAPAAVGVADYRLQAENVDLVGLPYFRRLIGSGAAVLKVGGCVRRHRDAWDVLYVRVPCPLALPAFVAARRLGRPVCLHVVGDLMAQMAEYPWPAMPLARLAGRAFELTTAWMARAALMVAQGEALERRFASAAGQAFNVIESTISERDIYARESRPLSRPVSLLYVGALLEKKGIGCLLEAVSILRRDHDVRLRLVGAGPDEAAFRRLAAERGLDEQVSFAGAINDGDALLRAYRGADVFVFPSFAEGVPRVLIEAMAQSLPVVSTAVGGIPGILSDRESGVLVPPGSPEALAAGITAVMEDAELRGRLVEGGLATARKLTREAHARELRRLLDEYVHARYPQLRTA